MIGLKGMRMKSKPRGGLRPPLGLRSRCGGRGFAGRPRTSHRPLSCPPRSVVRSSLRLRPLRPKGRPLRCGLASVVAPPSLVRAASGGVGWPQLPALSPPPSAPAPPSGRSQAAPRFTNVNRQNVSVYKCKRDVYKCKHYVWGDGCRPSPVKYYGGEFGEPPPLPARVQVNRACGLRPR